MTASSFRPRILCVALIAAMAACLALAADNKDTPIDFDKARQLFQKRQNGGTLTDEEQAYIQRAIAEHNRMIATRPGGSTRPSGPQRPTTSATGLIPLDQMTADEKYKGEDGGLYGGGKNCPPADFEKAIQKELQKIRPLDAEGHPAADGNIVLSSIGMSNTTGEFSKFKELADRDEAKSSKVVIVDCAQGGQDGAKWTKTGEGTPWTVMDRRLQAAGVSPLQVQAIWMKHAMISPAQYGDFPKHADELKRCILGSLQTAKQRFPNLRVVFLSSRIYAGYAVTGLNPEPYAYESAFADRRLILDQIKGEASVNFDPAKGDVKTPVLLWGPYLWGDGITPRKSDGLVWKRDDLGADGTHPSMTSGREKVARLLLDFFKTSPYAKTWFVK